MIRLITQCPYCGSEVGVDDDLPRVVFDPDRVFGEACRHLVFLLAMLEAYTVELDGEITYAPEHSGAWMWEHGQGLRLQREPQDEPLSGLIMDLSDGFLKPAERRRLRRVDHQVSGASAQDRERARPGTGCFGYLVQGRKLYAELSGWAVYSPSPARLAAAVRTLVS